MAASYQPLGKQVAAVPDTHRKRRELVITFIWTWFGMGMFLVIAAPAKAQLTGDPATGTTVSPSNGSNGIHDPTWVGVTTKTALTQRFEIYDPHSLEELQAIQAMGFTQVILDWPNLHTEATALGLDVVLANWWTHETPFDNIERALELARQVAPGRLVGLSMMDEPERNAPDTPFTFYGDLYRRLRVRLDHELPGVPLEISHWGPLASWESVDYYVFTELYQAADVMRIMPYPDLQEGPLSEVYFMMLRSRKLMQQAKRDLPLVVILQAWTLPPKSELPTIDELRVMAYQAILAGASTLSFYHYRPEEWALTPGFHEGFAELMRELTQFSERFADASSTSTMTAHGVLHSVLTFPSGETTTIRVNTNRVPAEGLLALAVEIVPVVDGRLGQVEPNENSATPTVNSHPNRHGSHRLWRRPRRGR